MAALDAHRALGSSVGHRDLVVGVPVITAAQQRILAAVADFQDEDGWYPSVREVGRRVGLASTQTVFRHVSTLIEAGLLEQNPTHSQMRITEAGRLALPIPYLPAERANQ